MTYVAFYVGMGVFLVAVALLHGGFDPDKRLIGSICMIALWPVILLVGPEALSNNGRRSGDGEDGKRDALKDQLVTAVEQKNHPDLEDQDYLHLTNVAKTGYGDVSIFSDGADFPDILSNLWDIGLHPEIYHVFKQASWRLDERYDPGNEHEVLFSLRQPEWYVGFSNEFVRSIAKVDRKLQGRILKALGDISAAPIQPIGDTIKPLSGQLKGLWRYRMGDDRLVYFPDLKAKTIVLICFSSRGDVYTSLPDVSGLTGNAS